MTAPGEPAVPPQVAALVEALDQRARQAGAEGASTLLRTMFTTVAEALNGIEGRLDLMEDTLRGRPAGATGEGGEAAVIAGQVEAGLDAFNARLGRLEEAFVQAVEDSGSGTVAVVDQLKAGVEAALGRWRGEQAEAAAAGATAVAERLAAIEQALGAVGSS
ncbi:MAG: hypothetical protein ACRD0M_11135, partial [Acidimicrobiales bacterium]